MRFLWPALASLADALDSTENAAQLCLPKRRLQKIKGFTPHGFGPGLNAPLGGIQHDRQMGVAPENLRGAWQPHTPLLNCGRKSRGELNAGVRLDRTAFP
jgi:hypothetical protein